jgi:hypothetical protein
MRQEELQQLNNDLRTERDQVERSEGGWWQLPYRKA